MGFGPLATLRLLGELAAPPRCGVCAAPCEPSAPVCPGCERAIRRGGGAGVVAGVGEVRWAAAYAGAARELVAALKFGGRLPLARLAGAALAARLPDATGGLAVVAVPPAPLRLRARGFDPAEEIARALAAELGLRLVPVLRRAGSRRQVGRTRSQRLASPPRVTAAAPVPARVLLVDDVLTTGATLAACARALRSGGVTAVRAAAFARALGSGAREA